MPKILITDDEQQIRRILSVMLREHGYEVAEAETGERAVEMGAEFRPDLALLDINMPGMDGIATLRALLEQNPKLDCIMMTAYGTIRSAVEAMRIGAFDYLTKPFDNDELLLIINRALELRRLSSEVEELRAELSTRYGFNEIVGISNKLQAVFRQMAKVAPIDATVLIEGESGTGKEMVARAIHRKSLRASKPFVAVNCGAIPQALFESEFFGHERGAFTDAREARMGRFEQAQDGTLFLDEVGELPLETQVKLLRALQEKEITRVGGRASIKLDVRVIAATNVDLERAVASGRFREDLYWRLNVVKLTLPPLRERREDIPLIIDHLMERFNRELGLNVSALSTDARRLLEMFDWPGNVRELENAVCSAMIMSEGGTVTARDLPPRIRGEAETTTHAAGARDITKGTISDAVREATEKLEKMMIVSRLAEFNGNRTATADSLGISRKTLFNKMRQYGLGEGELEDGA
ncbi:MAG: two-component system, NtrC family, response regulator AtoC [Acidobacteriota bacterium]|jgi:DNA-binding NtrC family response regulator|nr:two-component system, NtrC family, response regulator AtoC [Acidobacteriota bacterium]